MGAAGLRGGETADAAGGGPGADELGEMLRQARLAQGRELAEVAKELRIRRFYLEAIEDGRLSDLPGQVYVVGFLRAYGDCLGLDGADLVARYKDLRSDDGRRTDHRLPQPAAESRLPTASILLVAAILGAGVYGGWYYLSGEGRAPADLVPDLPERIAAMIDGDDPAPDGPAAGGDLDAGGPAAPPAPAPAAADAPVAPVAPIAETEEAAVASPAAVPPAARPEEASPPAVPELAAAAADDAAAAPAGEPAAAAASPAESPAERPPPEAAETADAAGFDAPESDAPESDAPASGADEAAEPEESAEPEEPAAPAAAPSSAETGVASAAPPPRDPAAGSANAPVSAARRVVLRARVDSWIEIRGDEDRPIYSGLLRAGQSYAAPSRPGLRMTTGNAGGLEILVDGEPTPPPGAPGAILRDFALDADRLLMRRDAAPSSFP